MTTDGRRLMSRLSGRSAESELMAAADELRKADPNLTQEAAIAKAAEANPHLHDRVLRDEGIPWHGEPSPPQPMERVAKTAPNLPGVDAIERINEMGHELAEAAGISQFDAVVKVTNETREGATHAAGATRDMRTKARYFEIAKVAPPFHEVLSAAKDARDDAVAKRLAELLA